MKNRWLSLWFLLIIPLFLTVEARPQDDNQSRRLFMQLYSVEVKNSFPEHFFIEPKLSHTHDSWFSPDKFDHLFVSALVSGCGFWVLQVAHNDEDQSLIYSVGVTVCLGAFKEVYDLHHPDRRASWKDLTVDFIGALLGGLMSRSI